MSASPVHTNTFLLFAIIDITSFFIYLGLLGYSLVRRQVRRQHAG